MTTAPVPALRLFQAIEGVIGLSRAGHLDEDSALEAIATLAADRIVSDQIAGQLLQPVEAPATPAVHAVFVTDDGGYDESLARVFSNESAALSYTSHYRGGDARVQRMPVDDTDPGRVIVYSLTYSLSAYERHGLRWWIGAATPETVTPILTGYDTDEVPDDTRPVQIERHQIVGGGRGTPYPEALTVTGSDEALVRRTFSEQARLALRQAITAGALTEQQAPDAAPAGKTSICQCGWLTILHRATSDGPLRWNHLDGTQACGYPADLTWVTATSTGTSWLAVPDDAEAADEQEN